MTKEYRQGILDAIKAIHNTSGNGCLCGHFDNCSGDCKPSKNDYLNSVKKLLH